MQYDEFISKVSERSGLDRAQAEAVTRATLKTLAQRITRGEADDVAAQLPKELKEPLVTVPEAAEPFDADEFERRVAQQAGLPADEAADGIRAVFSALAESLTGGEFTDMLSQLPEEYGRLVGPTASRAR
jgi:uncharacterized protein (DUF2267 family)